MIHTQKSSLKIYQRILTIHHLDEEINLLSIINLITDDSGLYKYIHTSRFNLTLPMMNQTATSVHLLTLGELWHNYDDPKALNTQLLFHANKPNQYLAQTIFHSTTWRILQQVVKRNNIKNTFYIVPPYSTLDYRSKIF